MLPPPLTHKHFHFVGIGGMGMSALARILHNQGFCVTGSDDTPSDWLTRLQHDGIQITCGPNPIGASQTDALVFSSAIPPHHPDRVAAANWAIPCYHRSDILAALMTQTPSIAVAGSHGKTTSTAILGTLLLHQNLSITVINGGIVNAWESNVYLGGNDLIVAEADESDGSMLNLYPRWILATNLDNDHLDTYETPHALQEAFYTFLCHVSPQGGVVLCCDDDVLVSMVPRLHAQGIRVITYGQHPDADVNVGAIIYNKFQEISFHITLHSPHLGYAQSSAKISLLGQHNAVNAAGCLAMGCALGLPLEVLCHGLTTFSGVKRRLSFLGLWKGVTFWDDYAHHPREISSTLEALKAAQTPESKIYVFFQPHRYSRFYYLQHEFPEAFYRANYVGVLPIYGSGETSDWQVSSDSLIDALNKLPQGPEAHGHLDKFEEIIRQRCQPGDQVVFMGAGDITSLADASLKALKKSL